MKNPASQNEYNILDNGQSRIKNSDYTENKIKIDLMKQNITKELAKYSCERQNKKKKFNSKNNQMQINLTNSTKEDLKDFKVNIKLLNEIIFATVTVISKVTFTNKIALSKPNRN